MAEFLYVHLVQMSEKWTILEWTFLKIYAIFSNNFNKFEFLLLINWAVVVSLQILFELCDSTLIYYSKFLESFLVIKKDRLWLCRADMSLSKIIQNGNTRTKKGASFAGNFFDFFITGEIIEKKFCFEVLF